MSVELTDTHFSFSSSSNGEPRFSFIVDMRQRTWENCKQIFKVLQVRFLRRMKGGEEERLPLIQEQFPYKIEHVYIVKPDGFWDKHKISLGMSKYTFEVNLSRLSRGKSSVSFQHSVESVDSLSNAIDRQQLTPDLNGTFQYHHLRWLEFRLVRCLVPSVHFDDVSLLKKLETFVYNSKETLHAYELLYNDLQQAELATNVARAQDAIETHMTVFKDQLSRVNIDPLITDGQHLLNMLRGQNDNESTVKSPSQQQRTYPLDYFDEARKISLVCLRWLNDWNWSPCFQRSWIIFVRPRIDAFNYGIRRRIGWNKIYNYDCSNKIAIGYRQRSPFLLFAMPSLDSSCVRGSGIVDQFWGRNTPRSARAAQKRCNS